MEYCSFHVFGLVVRFRGISVSPQNGMTEKLLIQTLIGCVLADYAYHSHIKYSEPCPWLIWTLTIFFSHVMVIKFLILYSQSFSFIGSLLLWILFIGPIGLFSSVLFGSYVPESSDEDICPRVFGKYSCVISFYITVHLYSCFHSLGFVLGRSKPALWQRPLTRHLLFLVKLWEGLLYWLWEGAR